ncbi:ribonucleoside-triphosphate reductase, adenosylcobalamin-dependent (plasmid) [Paenibacillus thiaminolyticus]|uniref:ribonucleoside-triphosphate reductase, adenosylcobalamin-dependent n=1 Tax=Paenibacillus thiaminolyticus TaxID=49283 RepID=UPI00232B6C3F|nr:ribonucleoside-triphosphate reductase, adenosylcobalamin-dependent [Paenibacillus thiaminolyticus]WCF11469.1 ribonucleoside-triphosphate reductase, adenosylcobalamin-dependent [Paenibacillus thiaminolyticus]
MQIVSNQLTKPYNNLKPPMTELGEFVFVRSYSRWLTELMRRETWLETIARTIDYNLGLELEFLKRNMPGANLNTIKAKLQDEARELLDNMFYLRLFASGRTMWVGGTEIAKKFPIANFNCSFLVLDSFEGFIELFYLLMVGSGVGFRTMPYDIQKISSYRTGIRFTSKPYEPIPKGERNDHTQLQIEGKIARIIVGDSKEGWCCALEIYFKILTLFLYNEISAIEMVYDNVRPKGERLVQFGGTASGHSSLQNMFERIHSIMEKAGGKLRPIDALDIANIIGQNVVSGGVRRTAEINLAAKDDFEIENAKNVIFTQDKSGHWITDKDLLHRTISNNSIFYESKPSREELNSHFTNMRLTGERGLVNAEAARKRRKDFGGLNPCAEILLADRGLCNLSTVNMMAFVEDGKLNVTALKRAFSLAARIGFRMTLVDLEIPRWDEQQKKDRLIGVSMTGFYDMVDATDLNIQEQRKLLRELRSVVNSTVRDYANPLNLNPSLLATTIKPEGTISQLPTVSSGIHRSHSPYFIRRVRISAHDPLAKLAMELKYPIYPETGQTWENANTLVVEFPVMSPAKKTKYEVTAIEQLETYKMFQDCYTDHNTSITVTVRNEEWADVEQWVWDNWDSFVAVSFLPLNDAVYPLSPYEAITEEEYLHRKASMKPFDVTLLAKFEKGDDLDLGTDGCESGVCPIR